MSYKSRLKALRGNTSDDSVDQRINSLKTSNAGNAANNKPWISPEEAKQYAPAKTTTTSNPNGYVSMADLLPKPVETDNHAVLHGIEADTGRNATVEYTVPKQETTSNPGFFGFFKELPGLVGQGIQVQAATNAAMATDDVTDPLEAAGIGFARGVGALPVGEAISQAAAGISGNEQLKANANDVSAKTAGMYQKANAENPVAYKAGNVLGSILLTRGINAGINAVLGPLGAAGEGAQLLDIPLKDKLIRSGITGAASFGGRGLIQNVGDVAAGRTSAGDYAKEALASGVGGALGGVASTAIGEIGHGIVSGVQGLGSPATINPAMQLPGNTNGVVPTLLRFGLEHNALAHTIVAGTSGMAFAGANIAGRQATRALEGLPQQNMSAGDVASEVLIGGAFGALNYIASYYGNTTVEKATQRGVKAYQDAEYAAANGDAKAYQSAVNDMQAAAQDISAAAGTMPGEEVSQAVEIINNVVAGMAAQDIVGAAQPTAATTAEPPAVQRAGNLPQYQPIEKPPVDAQRAQVGAEMAEKVAAPAETPAAQSAEKAPTAPAQVGQVTTIQHPYQGETPVQAAKDRTTVPVPENYVTRAQSLMTQADAEAAEGTRGFKTALTRLYQQIFQRNTGIPVADMTFRGKPYLVDIGKTVPGKVISDPNLSAEKLALLDILPDVVKNAEYVGSGEYVSKDGSNKSSVIRYDYFETPVTINEKPYIAKFDVEVIPGANNYRTHQIVNVDLATPGARLAGPVPAPSPSGTSPQGGVPETGITPTDTITPEVPSVNTPEVAQTGAMQYNGENTPKEAMTYGGEGETVERGEGSTGLRSGLDLGQSVRGGNAEQTQGNQSAKRPPAKDQGSGSLTLGKEVDAAYFHIADADASRKVRIVTGGDTEHTKLAKAIAGDKNLVLIAGGMLSAGGNNHIEAIWLPKTNTIVAPADDQYFTSPHYVGHEKCHAMINSGEITPQKVVDAVNQILPAGAIEIAKDIYAAMYKNNSDEKNMVELICDAAGNMNRPRAWGWKGVDDCIEILDNVLSVMHDVLNAGAGRAFELVPGLNDEMPSVELTQDIIGNAMADALDDGDIETAAEFSYRSLATAAGFKAIEKNGVREFVRSDGDPVTKVTPEDIKASPIGALIKYAADNGYLGNGKAANDENARKQIAFFAEVCTLAARNNDFAMSMQFAGAETFTAIKANSDTQYGTTYDYKSVCIKTQACIDQMSVAMVAKKGGLTKDEILGIYRDVNEIGLPVPCPECYVWNRWIGIGGLLDNIYKYQQRYGAMSFEEVKAAYDAMHDRVQAKAEEAGLSFGKAKTKLSAKITKEYQKQLDKVETTTNRGDKVSSADIEKLKTLEATMTDVKALTWIEDVYFGGKPMTKDNVSSNYRVPTDILFDLNRGAEFATQYKNAWEFRTTQGAGYGKAITPYSEATLGEGILGANSISKTVKDKAAGKLNNPFMDNNGELSNDAKRKLDTAVRKQKIQLFRGGQRFNSTSDASNDVASDYLLSMLEMQTMHGGVQIYTKVDGAVQYLSNVGAFINQSLMPLGSGLDADGNLRDTTIGGMSPKAAFANRKKYETAGTITIGVNDDHIRALYNDDKRDFIIPYHVSGGDAAVVSESRAIQDPDAAEAARVRSSDYTRTQNEKVLSDVVLKSLGKDDTEIAEIKQNREARIAILTRGKPNMEVVRANPILSKLYDMFNGGKWDGVKLPKSEIESHIYPNEFWDTEADYANSGINTELYLQYCDDLGILHKFSGMVPRNGVLAGVTGYDSKGNRVQLTDLAYKYKDGEITEEIEPYYWKTLIDHRMYGNAGQPLEQGAINLSGLGADVVKDFAKKNSGRTYDQQKSAELAKQTAEKFAAEEETEAEFSTRPDIARLEEENERLKQRLAEARAETKVTKGWRADPADVAKASKAIADSVNSKISQTVLRDRMTKLVEQASNGEISEDEVMATAGSIARDVIEKSEALASKDLDSYNAAKDYLKKVYINVPETVRDRFDDFGSFAETHKEMRMKTDGVPITDVYAELQRDLGKEYFPDQLGEKAMLQQIGDVMNSLAPVYGNQYSFAMQMVIEEMSNEVLTAAMDIGQKITYADRAAAKVREAKAENKATTEKLKTAESYIRSLQRIATRRMEQNEALKQHYAETRKRQKEARDLRQSQDKLLRVLKRLNNKKLPMATKQEILDAQNAVAGVVDTVQKYFTGELKQKQWTEQGLTDVGQLEEFIRRKTVEGLDPDMYDPNFIVDGATKRILDRYKMTSVKDMTATQIKELTQALLNIEARIAAEKKAVNSQLAVEFYEAGTQVIGDVAAAKPGNIQRKLRPLSAFLRMADYNDNSPLVVLYKEMLRGEEEADMYQREAIKPFSTLLSDHKWLKTAYGKDATAIKLPGVDIDGNNVEAEITPMMRVELYLDSLNDDNFRHVYEGGVVIPDMEWYRKGDMAKAYNNGKRVKFTRPTLQRLLEQMTPKEREFAKLLQNYYNEFAPSRMNPVSLALDGWEKFTTQDYYPISVDKNFLNADYEAKLFAADASLARPGFGEERIHSAKPIYLRDANTRFLQMVMANAMYAHQAIPLHNMNRLLNVQMIGNVDSVKAALNRQFPDGSADKYLSKFMADYAGHKRVGTSGLDKWLEKLRSNYSGGVLLMALSTAGVQAASYPTAAAVVSPAALFQALNPGAKIDTSFIDKRTAVFTKRTEGFSMMEMAELREQGKHIPKVLNWIQGVDVATTSLLKRAAYYEVRNTKHNLQPGTEEFEKAVTDTYLRIIEETQPNYSAALRPEVLRSDNAMERALIMFATQPLQQYGIVYDALGRYESASRHYKTDKSEANKAAKDKAAKGLGRAVGVILASSLAFALLRLGTDTLMGNFEKKYKPKEGSEDTEVEAFLRQFGMNMLGGVTGMWPIGKTLVEFIEASADTIATNLGGKAIFGKKWYGVETATIGAINDAMDAIATAVNYITRAINGKSETKTAVKKVVTAAEDIAVLFGIPAANVHKIIKAVAHWAGVEEDDLYDLIK